MAEMAKIMPQSPKWPKQGSKIYFMIWHQKLLFYWGVDTDIIFTHPKSFFDIPKIDRFINTNLLIIREPNIYTLYVYINLRPHNTDTDT